MQVADLALAAFLHLQGVRHQGAYVAPDGRRVIFEFEDEESVREAQLAYLGGQARVDPLAFSRALRAVRILTADIKQHDHLTA